MSADTTKVATVTSHLPPYWMVIDVESVGLHGPGFAVGYVVLDQHGNEVEHALLACPSNAVMLVAVAEGDATPDDARWCAENIPPFTANTRGPHDLLRQFWACWQTWRSRGAVMVADCAWPVEARFLAACIDDDFPASAWGGPYPLHELATLRLAAGMDPKGSSDRLPNELPQHNPLADARQSARLLREALFVLSSRCAPISQAHIAGRPQYAPNVQPAATAAPALPDAFASAAPIFNATTPPADMPAASPPAFGAGGGGDFAGAGASGSWDTPAFGGNDNYGGSF